MSIATRERTYDWDDPTPTVLAGVDQDGLTVLQAPRNTTSLRIAPGLSTAAPAGVGLVPPCNPVLWGAVRARRLVWLSVAGLVGWGSCAGFWWRRGGRRRWRFRLR